MRSCGSQKILVTGLKAGSIVDRGEVKRGEVKRGEVKNSLLFRESG